MQLHDDDGVLVDALEFRYAPNASPVLDDFSHHFPSRKVTSIIGASGRGKSTLLYIIAGILTPQGGSVRAHGTRYSTLSDRDRAIFRAHHFGFVFQDALLDSARSVLDNVCEPGAFAGMSRSEALRRARSLLERYEILPFASHLPAQISGGQAQRAALCRALLTEPTVILADEPTGNLDKETAELVVTSLSEAARLGATVILATHSPPIAEQSDEVLNLGRP